MGNQVHERIYIPDRTKALISGLNLKKPTHLRLYALSRYGQMSEPAVLELPPLQDSNTQYFEVRIFITSLRTNLSIAFNREIT